MTPQQLEAMYLQQRRDERAQFAAMAVQGILASWPSNDRALDVRATAETSVKHADALIAELAK